MIDKPEIGAPCNGCGVCCAAQICSAGSYALGLVNTWGARAPGPCPALVEEGKKLVCGVLIQPSDWLSLRLRPAVVRDALGLLIGIGAGCDDPGDEDEATAAPKIEAVQATHLAAHSIAELQMAADVIRGRW